jgi:hypothetical protein
MSKPLNEDLLMINKESRYVLETNGVGQKELI